MDTNPYQSPATDAFAMPAERFGDLPRVDGKYLVVASGMVLPPVCVKTNQPVTEGDLVRKQFYWCSPWFALLVLLSGLLLILVYFIARRKCVITFGLDPRLRKSYRRWMLLKTTAAILLFFAIPLSTAIDVTIAPVVVVVLFLVAVVSLFIGNSPLSVVKYRKGMFWIKGFSNEYLANFGSSIDPIAHRPQ
jgi:hypothetical protein